MRPFVKTIDFYQGMSVVFVQDFKEWTHLPISGGKYELKFEILIGQPEPP